jgi:hypothetical protein
MSKMFIDWIEALIWANESDHILVSTGITIEQHQLDEYKFMNNESSSDCELWENLEEYYAESDKGAPIRCLVKSYQVLVKSGGVEFHSSHYGTKQEAQTEFMKFCIVGR